MAIKKFFSRENLIRLGLLLAATAVILVVLPRSDHQSYSYELNQPWKYPLLTAEFDMPIMRDSTSARMLKDSINATFVPFVKRNDKTAASSIERFSRVVSDSLTAREVASLGAILRQVYALGIMEPSVYETVKSQRPHRVRFAGAEGPNSITTVDASSMLSPVKAFEYIDSAYCESKGVRQGAMTPFVARALSASLLPDVVIDSMADDKYRSQEYLNVNGALGVIKKGQRIVDRGEIISAQIYTNLNTYMEMLERSQSLAPSHTYFYAGQTVYILLCFSVLYFFLALYRSSFFSSIRKMTFLMTYITLFVVFSIVMFECISNGLYLVPFAAVPVVVIVFFDSRTAIVSLLVTVLISALVATFPHQFIFLEMMAGLAATFSIRQLSRRSQLLRTALASLVVYVVAYFAFCLSAEGNLDSFSYSTVGYFAINAIILSFAYVMIFVVEKIFGFTSTVTLVELSDINNKLLRRLAEEAPGTFQHSIQVSTLAAEAARAVGANTTLVRTGALYHDIGKLESPVFFTENQHGVNPHTGLNPETSAQKIISHVTAGLALASREKLPRVVKDFIAEHHGRGLARYFYNTAVNEEGAENVDISRFRYPGPDPQSKETAILMMADSVEAASRSLHDFSSASISSLVDRIVDGQMADGLLKDAPISFRDVEKVKETFKKRLATIYHSRVAYPTLKKEEKTDNASPGSGSAADNSER